MMPLGAFPFGVWRTVMRRLIFAVASAVALVAALAVGPLGTAAAAPYVYGCTPASLNAQPAYCLEIFI